jgi:5-methylcytosine-specific restriction endonuclease McrA
MKRAKSIHKLNPSYRKRKAVIPVAFREQIWLRQNGKVFESKCSTSWCQNTITVFDFQSGHNIPESKGGATSPDNLVPLCSRCNLSMGNRYTFDEWNKVSNPQQQPPPQPIKKPWWLCWK